MTPVDLFLLLPVAFAIMRGYRKGIIIEVFSLVALVLAIIVSMKFTTTIMTSLAPSLHGAHYLPFWTYAVVFIGMFILVAQLGNVFDVAANLLQLGLVNKVAGSAFSLVKILFMISLFFWLGDRITLIPRDICDHSFFYSHFHSLAPIIINKITPVLPHMGDLMARVEYFFDIIKA